MLREPGRFAVKVVALSARGTVDMPWSHAQNRGTENEYLQLIFRRTVSSSH